RFAHQFGKVLLHLAHQIHGFLNADELRCMALEDMGEMVGQHARWGHDLHAGPLHERQVFHLHPIAGSIGKEVIAAFKGNLEHVEILFSLANDKPARLQHSRRNRYFVHQRVFSTTEISSAVKAIQDRFDRVAAFAKARQITPTPSNFNRPGHIDTQFNDVISPANGASVASGLQNFMNAKKQILPADNASLQLAATGTLAGLTKHLDAPTLLAVFQMDASLKDQAINAGDTEEIN